MSYLRVNQRIQGGKLDAVAIGPGLLNWIEGSFGDIKRANFFGGFVIGSFNELNSIYDDSAAGVISQYLGGTFISDYVFTNAGFKIVPVGAFQLSPGSVGHRIFPTVSIQGSIIALFPVFFSYSTTGASIIREVGGLSVSANFIWFGWVVSAPSKYYT